MLKPGTRQLIGKGVSVAEAISKTSSPFVTPAELGQTLASAEATLKGPGIELENLLADPEITDILINSTDIWAEKAGELTLIKRSVYSEAQVRELAVRLAAKAGTRLDEAKPIADGSLADGTRINAIIPPLSPQGTVISIRTVKKNHFSLADLDARGMFPAGSLEVLQNLIISRASTLISGATGSGKTTLLSAVIAAMPSNQRILTIEDTAELHPPHPHVVSLLAKQANVQGKGAVNLAQLVQTALRMRPDRIILGECRGSEIRDLLGALNTGHQGSWGTLHANSATDVPARLEALGALAQMSPAAVHAQATAGVDALVHVGKISIGVDKGYLPEAAGKGSKLIRQIIEISALEKDAVQGLVVKPIWTNPLVGERSYLWKPGAHGRG
ncbi:helicase/secretion neighborhood ATPase [Gleimia coleocanis DSM 15436]|uniref:Helicase/secretion neighborhood ATPase n=1 Tax=Gleimia coleocanis DSM 15436 TaxID=525245 RepID=C0VYN2_9ACTO|nr:TadA family conjugal transfer-associated ATPase [Gleimia coleocanis]EEH64535.1 helicase/secretion neighborhood ATPase [Gleimia coleocanis DSM 15436]